MANATTIQLHLKAIGDFSDVSGDISQIQQMLNKIKMPASLKNSFDGIFEDLTKETTKYQRLLDSGFKRKGDVTGLESSGERINNLLKRLKSEMGKIDPSTLEKSFEIDPNLIQTLQTKISKLKTELSNLMSSDPMQKIAQSARSAAGEIAKISKTKFTSDFTEAFNKGDIDAASQALKNLEANHKQFNDTSKEQTFQQSLQAMKIALEQLSSNPALQGIIAQIREADQSLDQLDAQELEKFVQTFQQGRTNVESFTQGVRTFTNETNRAASAQNNFGSEVDQLKSQVQYFFGLTNAVYLLRDALSSALETVKELDAVMTETAVVTDFTIGDMWAKLPEYTEEASKLGAAVKDLYSATTLYYQQGLKTDAAMGVGIETMKMARIASMEASEATQAMTAALRGFGMEVNEINALRVNDVYSELAAITAADTEQIATAMSKTASIAAAANMEFETTAALLAQIIETTQEAPETAGTALKTIIARFSEVKELQNKGLSTGKDEEGEEIDVNKIDKALKSVGISMDAFFSGTEGLDSVLLRLAEKWESLDFTTQRYIATMAAGSRQQSRFIAMMSDYARTTELVSAANSSAGASQAQFNKTLDSMEAKLAQLKNAWDEFTMGIANNELLKVGIDLLTSLLKIINDITGALPGPLGGISKIGIVLLGLRLGGKIFDAFFTNLKATGAPAKALGKTISGVGVSIKKAFSKRTYGFDKELFSAKAAMSHYRREQEKANYATSQSAMITKTDANSKKEKAAWDSIAANSTKNMTILEKEYAAALGLTISQAKTAMALEQAGISTDLAAALALEGITEAELRNWAIKRLGTGATEADILATMKEIAVEKVGEKVRQKSLTTRIGETAQTLLNTLAKWGLVPANAAAAFSEKVLGNEAMATGVKMLISLGIIGLVIAAVLLLVAGIAALIKIAKDNSPEAKMKALEERAEKAAEAAEALKEEYETLLNTIEEYRGLEKNFEELEKGTLEWAKALQKINDQALELVKLYPILANYMTMTESGQLTFSDEGFTALSNAMMEQMAIAGGVASFAQIDVIKQKETNLGEDFFNSIVANTKVLNLVEKEDRTFEAEDAQKILEATETPTKFSILYSPDARTKVDLGKGNQEDSYYTYEAYDASGTYKLTEKGEEFAVQAGYALPDARFPGDALLGLVSEHSEVYQYSDEVIELAKEFGITAHELYLMRDEIVQHQNQMQALIAQEKAYSKVLVASAMTLRVATSSYGAGITNNLSEVLTPSRIDEIRNQESEEWANSGYWTNGKSNTNSSLKQKIADFNKANPENYIKVTGNERDDLKAYYEGLTGQEWTSDNSKDDGDIAKAIAEAEAAQKITNYGDRLFEIAANSAQAGQLLSGNLDTTYTGNAAGAFGLDASNADDKIIIDALDNAYEEIQEKREEINSELSNIFGGTTNAVAEFGSYKQASKFLDNYNKLVLMAGELAGELFATTFKAYAGDIAPNDLLNEFANIDWSSSIQGAAALKNMLENGSMAAKDFAANMILLTPAAYSATAQFNELYGLIGQEGLADLAKDGSITASEITALGKDCEEVVMVLDTTGISASTLGTYFELLEEGVISTADATDTFLKSLEQLNAASNTLSETFAFIDNFEPSRSQTEIGDYFADVQEEVLKLFDMGAYGDQRLIDYVKEFVGEENWGALIAEKSGDVKSALDEVIPLIKSYGTNMYGLWQQFANMDTDLVSLDDTGAINFDLTKIGSVDQLKQELMSKLNISEVIADAMIADAQTFSSGLSEGLNALSLQEALETWLTGALEIDGKKIISQSQLEAFAKEAGLDAEELKKAIGKANIGIEIIPYLDEAGNLQDEIYQVVIEQLEETGDLSSTYALLLELGLDDTMAKQTLTQMTNELQSAGKDVPFSVNGQQLQATGNVINGVMEYSTENGTYSGTMGGIIDGLKDPAVVAQQEISALQQGQIQADATAIGGVAASGAVIGATASMVDGLINKVVNWANTNLGWAGVNLKSSNLAGKVAESTGGLMDTASDAVSTNFASRISNAQSRFDNAINNGQNNSTQAKVDSIINNYEGEMGVLQDKETAYNNKNSQTEFGEDDAGDSWENPYDKFCNTIEKINEALREREKLERRYQKLVEKGEATANKLTENKQQQLATLQREAELQNDIITGRERQIANYIKEKGLGQYAYLEKNEFTGQDELRINWAEINKISDSEKGQEIEEYISQLGEWFGSIEEAQDSLEEIEDSVDEINEQGKEEYLDLEQTIKEALLDSYQKQIDELSNINDSINDANSKLIEAMQSSIDKYRQARDNEKAEDEIADKQARLAYLQQDTSGANATEILQLEKEIAEAQESHIDNLIDQKISALQEQNDKAAEQRERQIQIMEAQKDQYETSGEIWKEVEELMRSGLDPDTGLVTGSRLKDILKDSAGFEGMSKLEQVEWLKETNMKIADALSYLNTIQGTLPNINLNSGSQSNPDLNPEQLEEPGEPETEPLVNGLTKDQIKELQTGLKAKGYYNGKIDGLFGSNTETAVLNYQRNNRLAVNTKEPQNVLEHLRNGANYSKITGAQPDQDDIEAVRKQLENNDRVIPPRINIPYFHVKDRNNVPWIYGNPERGTLGTVYWNKRLHQVNYAYKTGGLADYTGPAWLDGTKSKPELVLNARDTQNFIQLKDILASLMGNTPNKTSEKAGEMTYDIDINIETIKDETDLDMIANYIENRIVTSANYRNNTVIGGRR